MTLADTWRYIEPVQAEVIGLAFTLFGAFLVHLFRPRVRLTYGRAANSLNNITVPDAENPDKHNSTEIYVEKFFLQNSGKQPASNVELVLSGWPNDISIWQPRDVEFKTVGKQDCLIAIPRVAPGELVTIDCVYLNKKAAFNSSVECAEALGVEVPFQTVRRFPMWFNAFVGISMVLGVAYSAQVILKLAGFAGW